MSVFWVPPEPMHQEECMQCGDWSAQWAPQATNYSDDRKNWVLLCEGCHQTNAEFWAGQWAEIGGLH